MSKKDSAKDACSHQPKDVHLAIRGIKDPVALADSIAIDAAADREWFKANPHKVERTRVASPRERLATGSAVGTLVIVRRGPHGSQIRMFLNK